MEAVAAPETESPLRDLTGWPSRLVRVLALALACYSLYWVVGIVQPLVYRVSFLLVVLVLTFLVFPATTSPRDRLRVPWTDWILAGLATAVLLLFVLGGDEASPEQQVRFASLPAGVKIDATLEPHSYGTEIHMYVHGVESGTLCRVALRGPEGVTYPAGTFRYRWGDDSDAVLSSALDLSRTRAVVVHAGRQTFVAPVNPAAAALNPTKEEST